MSLHEVITASLVKVNSKSVGVNAWGAGHVRAWAEPRGLERGIVMAIDALADYADAHAKRYEQPIGEEGVIGDLGWLPMLKGVRTMLNGELGRLDGGTLDNLLSDLAKEAGFSVEEYEG